MKNYREIKGWFGAGNEKGYNFLIENTPKGGTFVELGAWLGRSSAYLVDNKKDFNVIVIDSWLGSPDELDTNHKLAKSTDIYSMFLENMGSREYTHIRGLSNEVVSQFEDNSIDTMVIDATHTYESVKEDISIWLPKVKTGGIIAGDDYIDYYEGLKKAVDELLPNRKVMWPMWFDIKK